MNQREVFEKEFMLVSDYYKSLDDIDKIKRDKLYVIEIPKKIIDSAKNITNMYINHKLARDDNYRPNFELKFI